MKKGLFTFGFIALICALVIGSVEFLSFNKSYYTKKYESLDVANTIGVTPDDLMKATDHLLDYIVGKKVNLDVEVMINGSEVQMFNQREIDHMVDVQDLMMNVILLKNILILVSIAIFGYGIWKKDVFDLVLMRASLLQALLILGIVFGFIGMYAFIDFDSFWIQFHELLFSNDLWLLDPNTDRLIMMVPQAFFSGLVYRIILAIGLIVLSFVGLLYGLGRRIKHVAHRSL